MNVNFIFVHADFVLGQCVDKMPKLTQTPVFGTFRPRTANGGFRTALSCRNHFQCGAHGRHVNPGACFLHHRFDKHLSCPGRTSPTVVRRRSGNNLVQCCQIRFIQFALSILLPAIDQSDFSMLAKSFCDVVNGRASDSQSARRICSRSPVQKVDDDQITNPLPGCRTPSQLFSQPLLVTPSQMGHNS